MIQKQNQGNISVYYSFTCSIIYVSSEEIFLL